MKKALLLVLGIIAVCFLLANADYLADFANTLQTGALIPLIISIILMLGRHFVQAASYDAAFEAVGHRTGFWHNVVLIFSLVFINTFCLFSGATGVAFIIDDAHRRGCDAGQSTGGAILSQIGYFAAVFLISIIGFLTMLISGRVNWVFVVGALALGGTLIALSSLFFIGRFKPRVLFRIMMFAEKLANKVLGIIHKGLPSGWGRKTTRSFINTANILAENLKGTLITVAYASFSAILNMLCLVAIGYAFGFEDVGALVAAFSLAAISVILSPTPQGVGVVEAAITAILTAYGCSLATAAAIALVYRGIMFWVPFCIGAVLLSQSGFFASKKTDTQLQKHKDIAWISGTLVFLVGLVNIGISLIPSAFSPFTMLTSWVNMSSLIVGVPLIISSVFLMLCAVGLVLRFRTAWAITIGALVLVAGAEFLFHGTLQVGIAGVLLCIWLFWKRDAFDQPFSAAILRTRIGELKQDVVVFRERRAARKAEKESGKTKASERPSITEQTKSERATRKPLAERARENIMGPDNEIRATTEWERQALKGERIRSAVVGDTGALPIVNGEVKGVTASLPPLPSEVRSVPPSAAVEREEHMARDRCRRP